LAQIQFHSVYVSYFQTKKNLLTFYRSCFILDSSSKVTCTAGVSPLHGLLLQFMLIQYLVTIQAISLPFHNLIMSKKSLLNENDKNQFHSPPTSASTEF